MHEIDEDAWRTSVEIQLRGDDGKIAWDGRRQERLPATFWDDVVDNWREICAQSDEDMLDAVLLYADGDAGMAALAQTNVRYACPDRLDIAADAVNITSGR